MSATFGASDQGAVNIQRLAAAIPALLNGSAK